MNTSLVLMNISIVILNPAIVQVNTTVVLVITTIVIVNTTIVLVNITVVLVNNRVLDGVGPVDNRPSTVKLHHFVRERKNIARIAKRCPENISSVVKV